MKRRQLLYLSAALGAGLPSCKQDAVPAPPPAEGGQGLTGNNPQEEIPKSAEPRIVETPEGDLTISNRGETDGEIVENADGTLTIKSGPARGSAASLPAQKPAQKPGQVQAQVQAQAPDQSSPEAERAAVQGYFIELSTIQAGPVGEDPTKFAQALVTGALRGDQSGFKGLEAQMADSLSRLEAMEVPAPCGAYHAELVATTKESKTMLGDFAQLVAAKNADDLGTQSLRASALKQRAVKLDREAARLKKAYGVLH